MVAETKARGQIMKFEEKLQQNQLIQVYNLQIAFTFCLFYFLGQLECGTFISTVQLISNDTQSNNLIKNEDPLFFVGSPPPLPSSLVRALKLEFQCENG